MAAVITILLVIILSIIIIKVATISLTHTGLSGESAKFQAYSAFTGVGFATKEAELIVNHPVRRKIVMLLMLCGKAGIVSVIASLILTFVNSGGSESLSLWVKVSVLALSLIIIWIASNSKMVDRGLSRLIRYALRKYTRIDIYDYAGLLHLAGEYQISEVYVRQDDWLAGKTLSELALPKEGLFVLGINRKNGHYSGIPGRETVICPGDTLIIYGRALAIKGINMRKKGEQGNLERKLAEKEYMSVSRKEQAEDKNAIGNIGKSNNGSA